MDIFKDKVEVSAAKLTTKFREKLIVVMVIPRKINFTQMGCQNRAISENSILLSMLRSNHYILP